MKKRMLLALTLVVCLTALCACGSSNDGKYQVVSTSTVQPTQNLNLGGTLTATDEPTIDYDDGTYDPASEEGTDLPDWMIDEGLILEEEAESAAEAETPVPTVRSEYAGATPVVIDPIDKPTPTPVPPLSFTYQVYDATKLGLSFEAPVGWLIDDSGTNTFVLTNPDPSMDYAAAVIIETVSVGSDMSKNDLVTQIKSMLTTIGQGMATFSPSNTAERTLLDNTGVYANYTGTLQDGTAVAGRIHVTCLNKVLYTVHVTYPQVYTDTYKEGVYDQLRHTIKITQ